MTFQGIMDDLATLHVLGVKLVILVSVRLQVDGRLLMECETLGRRVQGLRVTGPAELAAVQVECGLARSRVEAAPRLQAVDHAYGCGSGGGKGPATSKCARSHDAWGVAACKPPV